MGRGKRRRIEPTDDWELLLLLGVRAARPDPCICRRSCSLTSTPCDGGIVKCLIWDFDGALAHLRRVLRTLGEEVEAVRRVIRSGREEVRVPEFCFSHGDQENPPKLSHPTRVRCLHVQDHRQRRRHDQHDPDPAG